MASSKATAFPSKTVIFVRCHFVWARIKCPRESLKQHAKDVRWLRSWNAASTLHFNHVSLGFSQTELLPCIYSSRVAHLVVRDVYEPLTIVSMHLVMSFQCLLKYDERHSKWHHYVQPKFFKGVKSSDPQCLGFLNNICQKRNMSNFSQFQLAFATQSKVLPNTNSHAPPYNSQKHANHPQQPYHTRDMSPHIVHVVIVVGDASEHNLCKSSITNYVLYEGNSPWKG